MAGIPLAVSSNSGGAGGGAPTQADQLQTYNALNGTTGMNSTTPSSTLAPSNGTTTTTTTTTISPLDDDVEGSGDDDNDDTREDLTSILSIGSFITRAALFRRSLDEPKPHRTPRQFFPSCTDRITLPCIVEDFIAVSGGSVPTCRPVHCG